MKIIENEILNEKLYSTVLDNGLEILFLPKEGFLDKFAIMGVDFGAQDLVFKPKGKEDVIKVNEGIAHFLEHKMFEQPDGSNVFKKFTDLGLNANAYTNYDMTAYLFGGTDNFHEGLDHLISYVNTPYYTDENVEKEKGIIIQEIKMYDDNPSSVVYYNALRALYSDNFLNIDIAGTEESVLKITKEELYDCYNTFYSPENMCLFVIGDLKWEEILETVENAYKKIDLGIRKNVSKHIDEKTGKTVFEKPESLVPKEPEKVANKEIISRQDTSIPLFFLAYKELNHKEKGKELLKKELKTDIAIGLLFGRSSSLYEKLYNEGYINDSFGGAYLNSDTYAHAFVGGESKDPEYVKKEIFRFIKENDVLFTRDDFELEKRKKTGYFLSSFDLIQYIANNFLSYRLKGINFLDYLEVLNEITYEEVLERADELFVEENSAMSIVRR